MRKDKDFLKRFPIVQEIILKWCEWVYTKLESLLRTKETLFRTDSL